MVRHAGTKMRPLLRKIRRLSFGLGAATLLSITSPAWPAEDDFVLPANARGVTPPKLVARREPNYPEALRKKKLEARLVFRGIVRRSGALDTLTMLNCDIRDRHGIALTQKEASKYCLEAQAAAEETLSAWRYEPAQRYGEPVDIYYSVRMDFRLR